MKILFLRRLILFCFSLLFLMHQNASAQSAPPAKTIALYPNVAPGSESWTWSERVTGSSGNPVIQNVVHPELLYYPADKSKAVGTAVIVAPGGGFQNLMMSYEGVDIATQFTDMGVDAFVLKYRLKYTDPNAAPRRAAATAPAPAARIADPIRTLAGEDGQQAVRLLRKNAGEYGFRPDRIGFVGFSAGGAVGIRVVRGEPDGRPDFAALIYAGEATGDPPPAGAPPLFLAVAADDQNVGFQGDIDLFSAWRKANIPVELHIYQTGAHGFRKKGGGADHFMDRLAEWMKVNGYLNREASK